jgi:hypothetical protein
MPDSPHRHHPTAQPLNSTALKWCDDGELSAPDLQRILKLLTDADPVAESLLASPLDAVQLGAASQGPGHAVPAGQTPQAGHG